MGRLTAMRDDIFPNHPLPLPEDATFSLEKARILAWAAAVQLLFCKFSRGISFR